MKLNILTTAAILAITAAFMTQSAKAQLNTTNGAPAGDLILGFSAGGTNNFEIDLGSYTLYQGNSQINIVNIASDLSTDFTSNWFTNSSLSVAFAGETGNTALISDPTTTKFTSSNSSIPTGSFAPIYQPENSTPVPTAGTASGSLNVSINGGANTAAITVGMSAGGYGFGTSGAKFGSGAPQLYLDVLSNSGGKGSAAALSTLGANPFTVTSAGEVVYDLQTQSVPEPSTYALGVAGLVLLIALKRRQSVAKL